MKLIDRIVISNDPPRNTSLIWINPKDKSLNAHINGKWVPLSSPTEDIPISLADLNSDADHRLVTDAEKRAWDSKQDEIESVSVSINNTEGAPFGSAILIDGVLTITLSNVKGEAGAAFTYADFTQEQLEALKVKGDQGDSAVYNPNAPDTPDFVMANTIGQSTTKSMTQKAVTDAIEDKYALVLSGRNSNYFVNKCVDYQGNIISRTGWCCFKEPIPCNGTVTKVVWRMKTSSATDSEIRLVYYNANMEKVYAKSNPSASDTSWTDNNPGTVAYINASFKADVNIPLTITIDNVVTDFPRIDSLPALNDVGEIVEDVEDLDARLTKQENKDNFRLHVKTGYMYVAGGGTAAADGWSICTNYLPCTPGEIAHFRYGLKDGNARLVFYNANKEYVTAYSANETDGIRDERVDAGVAYLRTCWYKELAGQENTTPIIIDTREYFIDDLSKIRQMEADLYAEDTTHGVIGKYYPDEAHDISVMGGVPNASYFKRLWFLHTSDNHGGNFGYAEEFVDYCKAKFVINTGDLVQDKFTDSKTTTLASAKAPSKPTYLVFGNHDYYKATSKQDLFDAFFGDAETEGTLNYHNVQNGGVSVDKTYYSINYSSEGVKCIFLDMNEGFSDDGLSSRPLSDFSIGKMSQTQIEWFISELQAAKTAGLHVCIFIHILAVPRDREKTIPEFTDSWTVDWDSTHTFLHDLVDKFMVGGTVSWTYNGHNYSATFSSGGHFVGWFCGHAHYDSAGWLKNYPNQFAVIVTCPYHQGMYGGTYEGDKLGVHFNFVTIDTMHYCLSVYRVGNQETVFGTDRKSFKVYYK